MYINYLLSLFFSMWNATLTTLFVDFLERDVRVMGFCSFCGFSLFLCFGHFLDEVYINLKISKNIWPSTRTQLESH
jgi:hypothetical protein